MITLCKQLMSVLLRTLSPLLALKNHTAMLWAVYGDAHMARNKGQAPASKKLRPLLLLSAKN